MQPDPRYDELAFYTLAHPDPAFIHQHLVDAYTAQHVDQNSKPIATVFALIGLYLYLERGFTGKQVQLAHMQLAKRRRTWTSPPLPPSRGSISIHDVLAVDPSPERDLRLRDWCDSVWQAWQCAHRQIALLAEEELGIRRSEILEQPCPSRPTTA